MNKNLIKKEKFTEINVSVIAPFFNESTNLPILNDRLLKILRKFNDYEIIYVNDGSTDTSSDIVKQFCKVDNKIKLISFSRNFGQQAAYTAGINNISFDIAVLIDSDLQDPPELINDFVQKIKEGYNVVYAIKKNRKENIIKKTAYNIFYRSLHNIANIKIPIDAGEFGAFDKKIINSFRNLSERNKYIPGLRSWIGFKQIGIEYNRDSRLSGKPKYNYFTLLKLAYDGIISFSFFPLKIASFLGFIITFFCAIYIFIIIFRKLMIPEVEGWPSIMVSILFLGGIQLFVLGIIGEYIGRIFDDVKKRPHYIISETENMDENKLL